MLANALPAVPPDPALPRELEWQLAGADLARVQRWLSEHATIAGLAIEARPTLLLRDRYFDTADWRLHRAGYALRIRGIEGASPQATLKSLRSARSDAALRVELNEPLNEASSGALERATGPVGERVHAVVGREPLRALFEVRTRRRRYSVRGAGAEDVGEIALDAAEFARPGGEPRGTTERVEVESLAPDAPLEALVGVLRSECGLARSPGSKYALGLESVGLAPPQAPAAPATVAPGAEPRSPLATGELARAAIAGLLAKWRQHEPAARLGDDPEELHELRNAVRRLALLLGLYADDLPKRLARARDHLKALQALLGAARDCDVSLAQLAAFAAEEGASACAALEPLVIHERAAREQARRAMLRGLDSARTARVQESLRQALESPAAPPGAKREGAAVRVLPELLRARYKKLKQELEGLDAASPSEAFHQARSQVKKLRYSVESTGDLYGKPAISLLKELRRLQDRLGAQQDAQMARLRLDALAAVHPALPPATLFLMGRIAERHAGSIALARAGLGRPVRRLRRRWKRLREAFASARRQPPPAPAA